MRTSIASLCFCSVFLCGSSTRLPAETTANTNPIYQQLRALSSGSESFRIEKFDLKRDAATFHLQNGTIAFFPAVNGKITGAVFHGSGHLHITPPTATERHNLSVLEHREEFDEDFDELVLRFGDQTAAELKQASQPGPASPTLVTFSGTAPVDKTVHEFNEFSRNKLHENLDLRLLADVLSPAPGGYFFASIHGSKNSHLYFTLDPQGTVTVAPEEIALVKWNGVTNGTTIPLAFHRTAEYANGTASGNEHNASYVIDKEDLDVTIEKSGFLSSLARITLHAQQDGVAVIPFNLYSTLRVSKVETSTGEGLSYVQEKKDEDPDFGVILAKPLNKGESITLNITYGGKDVVLNEGNGNYYPTARLNWYPNSRQELGDYAIYHMLFHVPKGLQLIATGTKVSENTDGNSTTTEWKADTRLAVAGFTLGDFANKDDKATSADGSAVDVSAYANHQLPDILINVTRHNSILGALETTPMMTKELSEGVAATKLYSSLYGPLPFTHLSLTQQTACNYGQSWPMLVYLPVCGFVDDTQRHFLIRHAEDSYWKIVTPHEVAHQWWGQTVGFRSYRDQWMSEGFADASAAIYLQVTRPNPDEFRAFWKEESKMLTEKNQFGFRPIDLGPVTMGYRLESPEIGWNIPRFLIYPKGAYILHMLRMMMWTAQDGDARFKATMQDFAYAFRMKAATTEDFKATVEKHIAPSMNLGGNAKMDWFFNEYVYGTELPTYHFEQQVIQNGDATSLHYKLTQSGVSANFRMPVPVYLELTNGRILRLGMVNMAGNNTVEQTINLPKLPAPVKRALINYYYDVLSLEN